jgi:hypothetical protein
LWGKKSKKGEKNQSPFNFIHPTIPDAIATLF